MHLPPGSRDKGSACFLNENIQSRLPVHGMVLPTFRVIFPPHLRLWKYLHRYSQMCVSLVTLNPVNVTRKPHAQDPLASLLASTEGMSHVYGSNYCDICNPNVPLGSRPPFRTSTMYHHHLFIGQTLSPLLPCTGSCPEFSRQDFFTLPIHFPDTFRRQTHLGEKHPCKWVGNDLSVLSVRSL